MTNTSTDASLREKAGSFLNSNKWTFLLEVIVILAPIWIAYIMMDYLGYNSLESWILPGILSIVISLLLVSLDLWLRGSNWRQYGFTTPNSWLKTLLWSFLFIFVFLIVLSVLNYLTIQVMGTKPPNYSRFDSLGGNMPLLIISIVAVWISAAFGEELLFRGFLIKRIAEIFGENKTAWSLGVIISSALFGIGHIYQGITGVILSAGAGLVFGTLYLLSGKNLCAAILAHGLIDTAGFIFYYAKG